MNTAKESMDPVQAQLDAYNARDLDRFVACYAEGSIIEDGTGRRMMEGREALRATYGAIFAASPQLHAEVSNRIRVGDFVVDEEHVTGLNFPGLPSSMRAAVAYRVQEGLIVHVRIMA